jgi:hypothetical protein
MSHILLLYCFQFLFPETQEHNFYVMEFSKCNYVKSFVLQQLRNKEYLT